MVAWNGERADVSFGESCDMELLAQQLDFLGVNYYEHPRVAASDSDPVHSARRLPAPGPVTHAGSAIEPAWRESCGGSMTTTGRSRCM